LVTNPALDTLRRANARIAWEGRGMYGPARSQSEELKKTVLRVCDAVAAWSSDKFDSTETRRTQIINDGLGFKIFVRSIRAKELLQDLQQEVYPNLLRHCKLWLEENGEWSITFFFSEPIESPNYVRINPNWDFPNPLR